MGQGMLLALARAAGLWFKGNFGEGVGGLTRNLLGSGCRKTFCIPFFLFCLPHPPTMSLPSIPLGGWLGQAKDSGEPNKMIGQNPAFSSGKSFLCGSCLGGKHWPVRGGPAELPWLATTTFLTNSGSFLPSRSNLETPKLPSLPFPWRSPLGFCWAPESGFLCPCALQRHQPEGQWGGRSAGGGHFIWEIKCQSEKVSLLGSWRAGGAPNSKRQHWAWRTPADRCNPVLSQTPGIPPDAVPGRVLAPFPQRGSLYQSGIGTSKTPLTSNHSGLVRAPLPPQGYPISKSWSGPPVKEVRPIICDVPN